MRVDGPVDVTFKDRDPVRAREIFFEHAGIIAIDLEPSVPPGPGVVSTLGVNPETVVSIKPAS